MSGFTHTAGDVYCDGCGRKAPNRRPLLYGQRDAPTLAGHFGRVCYRKTALALKAANEQTFDQQGRDV